MSKVLIKLTPLEPYFFGGERIHEIGDQNKHYFIRSLDIPSQTMLFGVLRYLAIENPGAKAELKNQYEHYKKERCNGNFKRHFQGFALNMPDVKFGNIHGISPLYLYSEETGFLIRTPFDHKKRCGCGNLHTRYAPFSKYSDPIKTSKGERCLPLDYNAKDFLTDSWMSVDSGIIYDDLFRGVSQIGIKATGKKEDKTNTDEAKTRENSSFFKKEYKMLKDNFCFAFFADIDMNVYERTVYMGQNKSSFRAEWMEVQEPDIPNRIINTGMVYAQSDIYCNFDIEELYGMCKFSCVKTCDHRIFNKNYLSRDRKSDKTIKLIQSGSVFIPNDPEAFADRIRNSHAQIAGFNKIIIGGKS